MEFLRSFFKEKKGKQTNQNVCFLERLQGRAVPMSPEHGEGVMPISASCRLGAGAADSKRPSRRAGSSTPRTVVRWTKWSRRRLRRPPAMAVLPVGQENRLRGDRGRVWTQRWTDRPPLDTARSSGARPRVQRLCARTRCRSSVCAESSRGARPSNLTPPASARWPGVAGPRCAPLRRARCASAKRLFPFLPFSSLLPGSLPCTPLS